MDQPLTDPRHEIFAQKLALGFSQVSAYEAAGYQRHESNAARLITNDKVKQRVRWFQQRAARACGVTLEERTQLMLDAEVKAAIAAQAGGTVGEYKALTDIYMNTAKLNGLIVDKSKVEQTVKTHHETILDIKPLSREDRAALNKMMERAS